MSNNEISYGYIRGLVENSGNFTFLINKGNNQKIPCFSLKLNIKDKDLLIEIRNKLGLKNNVYEYKHPAKDSTRQNIQAIILVRDLGSIKNIIIPLFVGKLVIKKNSFEKWVFGMGNDLLVPDSYRFIYKLYKAGFYKNNNRFD